MTLKEWLKYNLYKKLWSVIGKRPWTFLRRDVWHQLEIINIVFFVSVGFFSGIYFNQILAWLFEAWWHVVILVAGFYFVGVLQGHFYWGTRYIENQQGK